MTASPPPEVVLPILLRRPAPGLWASTGLDDVTIETLRGLHRPMLCFDLRSTTTKAAVLDALGDQGDFPDHYGRNWDAAYDCLTDRSPEIVVVRVSADLPLTDARALTSIFADAAEHWIGRGLPTYVLWDGPAIIDLPSIGWIR